MRLVALVLCWSVACAAARAEISIEIDLAKQKAFLLDDGEVVEESPISSGRYGHLTPRGNFEVLEKDLNHHSSLYGKIVSRSGRVLVSDADSAMRVPAGARFVEAPMKYFMRFSGASGMHAGYLPGYPASHGCVRLPLEKAGIFYNAAGIGTPVIVYGVTPTSPPRSRRPRAAKVVRTPLPVATPRKPWNPFQFLFPRK
jgi:hypothetical protein